MSGDPFEVIGFFDEERGRPLVRLRVHGGDDTLVLSPLQVGRLRAALRDAAIAADDAGRTAADEQRRRA